MISPRHFDAASIARDHATYLRIDLREQSLTAMRDGINLRRYPVSTAQNGPGERHGSECTPRGWHRVRARIGAGMPINTVFVGRRATGEIYTPALAEQFPKRDWILTRILWLSGIEPGKNRYGHVDTARRYIYIHGCPDHCAVGRPDSHGCVRMRNRDIVELFDVVEPDHLVLID